MCAMSALGMEHGNAICYSGYREGQHPDRGDGAVNPSREEILQDLMNAMLEQDLVRVRSILRESVSGFSPDPTLVDPTNVTGMRAK